MMDLEKQRAEEGKIGVLLVDDHPIVRDGIAGILRRSSRYMVLGEADTAAGAIKALAALQPRIALVDLRLPDADGIKVLEAAQHVRWTTYTVVLSAFRSDDDLVAAARAGARAYLLKSFPSSELLEKLEQVLDGQNLLEEELSGGLHDRLWQRDLTFQETRILGLIGEGRTNKEICRLTRTMPNTVKAHLRSIFTKLGVSNRAQAATIALRRGISQ